MSLITNVQSLATRVGTEFKTLRASIASSLALKADAASVYSKSESDAALALKANAADVYTISQADLAISTAVNDLVGAAPGTLDTLAEIAAAIENDQTAASALTQEVALKAYSADVYAKSETYSKSEVDAIESGIRSDIGADFATANFVSTFEAALVASSGGYIPPQTITPM